MVNERDNKMMKKIGFVFALFFVVLLAQNVSSATKVWNFNDYNVTAPYFIGDGSGLTNLNVSEIDLSDYIPYTGATSNVNLGANNFLINNSVFFVNSTSGRVGIGTTAPGQKLDLYNGNFRVLGIDATDNISVNSPDVIFRGKYDSNATADGIVQATKDWTLRNIMTWNSGAGDSRLAFLNNSGTEVVTVLESGNVGIGTTGPRSTLHIYNADNNAQLNIDSGGSDKDSAIFLTEASNDLYGFKLYYNSNDFYIDRYPGAAGINAFFIERTNGNVGIGTTSPDYKLQVNGTIAPETNATFDLGASSLAWNNVYAVTYNDLTPAWENETDGSALTAVSEIKSEDGELDHESYPVKLRSKYFIVETEEEQVNQVEVGVDEDNKTIYEEEKYKIKVKKEVKVDENLTEDEQVEFVAEELDVSVAEVGELEIIFTRDLGGTVTMIIESIKELFGKVSKQDDRITMLETELCKKDDSYSWCEGLGIKSVEIVVPSVLLEDKNETVEVEDETGEEDSFEDVGNETLDNVGNETLEDVGNETFEDVGNETLEEVGNETFEDVGNETESVEEEIVNESGVEEVVDEGIEDIGGVDEKKEKKVKEESSEEEIDLNITGITGKVVRGVGETGSEIREWFVSNFNKVLKGIKNWFE